MSEAKRVPHNKQVIDEQFIIDNFHTMTGREIGEALGVSRETINHRARKLGLRKSQLPFEQMPDEIVKAIPKFEGYALTSKGRVVRLADHTLVAIRPKKDWYTQAVFYIDGKNVYANLHRLLAELFIPNPNNFPVVNHIDGDKTNCDLSNLEWTTIKGNAEHASDTGLLRKGETSPNAKITEAQARAILDDSKAGLTNAELRQKYPFATKSIIEKIVNRTRWKSLERATTSRKA